MIKVVKNQFNDAVHTVVDREVWYSSNEGLEYDIWTMSYYIENMIGHMPVINRNDNLIEIGTSDDKIYIIWNIEHVEK